MWNARLDETQAEIKNAGRNINNLRYADDIILMAESEEELKSLLMKVKGESEKASLKVNIQKTKIDAALELRCRAAISLYELWSKVLGERLMDAAPYEQVKLN